MLKKYSRIYIKFLGQYFKILTEYKVDFIVGLTGFFIVQTSGFVFLSLVFKRIPNLNGWSFDQIVFIYGFAQLPRGLDHLLTDNIWGLTDRIIIKGEFDRYLLRPINPLFHLLAEVFQPDAFGELIIGITLVLWSIHRLHLNCNFLSIFLFLFMVICGAVIYASIKLFFASFAFWIKNSHDIVWMNYSLSDFTKYPITIYPKLIQYVISFVIPVSFTTFYPASYFIGKIDFKIAVGGTFLVAVIASVIAYTTWLRGIRIYESTGN